MIQFYKTEETIFKEADEVIFIYIIIFGQVKLIENGQNKTTLREGQLFGEEALLVNRTKRISSIQAMTNTEVISIYHKSVIGILGSDYKEQFNRNIILNSFMTDEHFKFLNKNLMIKISELFELTYYLKDQPTKINKQSLEEKAYVICSGIISFENIVIETHGIIGFDQKAIPLQDEFEFKCNKDACIAEISLIKLQTDLDFKFSSFKRNAKNKNILNSLHLFDSLDPKALDQLSKNLVKEEYPKGEYLYLKNDADDTIYILINGSVGLFFEDNLIAKLDKISIFGETCIEQLLRTVTAKALTRIKCLELKKNDIFEVMNHKLLLEIQKTVYYEYPIDIKELKISYHIKTIKETATVIMATKDNIYYLVDAIHKKLVTKSTQFSKFVNYKVVLMQIKHPQIPKLIKTILDEEILYFIYEYVSFEYLSSFKHIKFSETSGKFILLSLGNILHYLELKRILHRDICPENILIDEKGYI